MAKQIFELIQQEPEYFAWSFAVVNALWAGFVYFNKKRHDGEIEKLKQSLNLDLERRRKVFEMKAKQYEAYFNNIDAFQTRHQADYQNIIVPLLKEFTSRYLAACNRNDRDGSTNAIIWFGQQISTVTHNGFQEQQALELQTNGLKLTASNEVAILLEELKSLYNRMFELSTEQMRKLVEVTMNNDQDAFSKMQLDMAALGEIIKAKSQELREEMRKDLQEI